MHPRFLLQAMGRFKHAIAVLYSVSCPLEFHNLPTRCQYGTKQTCHSVLSDVCLDAAHQAMFQVVVNTVGIVSQSHATG